MDALGRRFALLLLLVLGGLLPATAHADTRPGAWQQRDREGLSLGLRLISGTTLHGPQGFTPVTRFSYAIGGVVNRQLILGADLGVTAWWDDSKASFHGDAVGQLFIVRGLFLRAGTGVASHTYVAGDRRAAFGGSLGGGWEFPLKKRGFVSLSAEYDARVRSDRFAVRTVLFGVSIGGFPRKK